MTEALASLENMEMGDSYGEMEYYIIQMKSIRRIFTRRIICAILLDDRDLAQDVVQETFIRVYKKMDSFRGARPESEKAWLTRIAVNLCRDEKRKSWFRLRERAKPIDMTAIPMEDATEEARELYAAVQALPKKYREVILLRFYQDLTAPEIAEILHQATGTIYHKLTRAQEMLKKRLERCDFGG